MATQARQFAIVTGASAGIGEALARHCADNGFDLLVAADDPSIEHAAAAFRGADAPSMRCRPTSPTPRASTSCMPRSAGGAWMRCWRMPGAASATASSTRTPAAWRNVVDTNITGTLAAGPEGRPRHARRRRRPHPDHRLDRRLHARHLPGGLQRHQGVPRQLLLRAAPRAEGQRRDRHLPDARRHRDRFLRARRHDGHQGRHRRRRTIRRWWPRSASTR